MNGFHLLLVDDHENIRFTFGLALESDGYDVDTAGTLTEARGRMQQRCYDALILDLRLGADSGLQLLTDLRASGNETPALMISAHGDIPEAVAAMKLGAVDFLEKPLQPEQFRAAVAQLLSRTLPKASAAPADRTCERHIVEARHALNTRDFLTARLHLASALQINSQSADAHYLFGMMLEQTNEEDRAKRYYRRALQLYAEHSLTHS